MSPSAFLTSTNGCQSFGPTPASFNMGFFTHFKLSDEVICKGLTIGIYDSIRYYQRGEEDPVTFPTYTIPLGLQLGMTLSGM